MTRRHTRPLRALWRVLMAPGFVLALWLASLAFARVLASPVRAAAKAAMANHTWFADGHQLRALFELLASSPAIATTLMASLGSAAILATLFSMLAAPAILVRLDGQRSLTWMCAAIGRELPAMVVQGIYGLIFRALGLGAAALLLAKLELGALPLALLLAGFPMLVLDRARAAVVLDDERPFHPMTFLRAIVRVSMRPLWIISGVLIDVARLLVAISALLLVLRAGPSDTAIWVARASGLLALGLGLWRISLAVEDRQTAH